MGRRRLRVMPLTSTGRFEVETIGPSRVVSYPKLRRFGRLGWCDEKGPRGYSRLGIRYALLVMHLDAISTKLCSRTHLTRVNELYVSTVALRRPELGAKRSRRIFLP
jgi:hypothetical protein